jgi:23S rRNA-/tRNA-specific pseudouridylate synthase
LSVSTALKRTVRRGDILVNGTAAKVDHTMQLGDQVQVVTRVGCSGVDSCHRRQLQQSLPGLDVAWEDEHMAVVVKPQVGGWVGRGGIIGGVCVTCGYFHR